jgi:hypothetical protein
MSQETQAYYLSLELYSFQNEHVLVPCPYTSLHTWLWVLSSYRAQILLVHKVSQFMNTVTEVKTYLAIT